MRDFARKDEGFHYIDALIWLLNGLQDLSELVR
jgi:hypothetical protein